MQASNINIKLHYYQKELIKKLSLNPQMRFNDLLIKGLESEHMNYHLKKLLEIGLVIKKKSKYVLTDSGKDYSNLLDDQTDLIEKQPKTSVIIQAKRKNKKGEVEHLLTKRLRQPYYGKVGHPTGKVRFGETLKQAAKRELFEETGLIAQKYYLENIYRKMRKRNDNKWIQDVIFYIFLVLDLSGRFISRTKYQENFWITKRQFYKRNDLDTYDDFNFYDHLDPKPLILTEVKGLAEGF